MSYGKGQKIEPKKGGTKIRSLLPFILRWVKKEGLLPKNRSLFAGSTGGNPPVEKVSIIPTFASDGNFPSFARLPVVGTYLLADFTNFGKLAEICKVASLQNPPIKSLTPYTQQVRYSRTFTKDSFCKAVMDR